MREALIYEQRVATDETGAALYLLNAATVSETPIDWEHQLFGTALFLQNSVLFLTGFDDNSTVFDEAEQWYDSGIGQLETTAITLVASLDLEKLRTCDPKDYNKYIVIAKKAIQAQSGYKEPQQASPTRHQQQAPVYDTTPRWESEGSFSWSKK